MFIMVFNNISDLSSFASILQMNIFSTTSIYMCLSMNRKSIGERALLGRTLNLKTILNA